MATFGRRHIIAIANGFIAAKPPLPVWENGPIASLRHAKEQAALSAWRDTLSFVSEAIKDSDPEFSEDEFLAIIRYGKKVKDDA